MKGTHCWTSTVWTSLATPALLHGNLVLLRQAGMLPEASSHLPKTLGAKSVGGIITKERLRQLQVVERKWLELSSWALLFVVYIWTPSRHTCSAAVSASCNPVTVELPTYSRKHVPLLSKGWQLSVSMALRPVAGRNSYLAFVTMHWLQDVRTLQAILLRAKHTSTNVPCHELRGYLALWACGWARAFPLSHAKQSTWCSRGWEDRQTELLRKMH